MGGTVAVEHAFDPYPLSSPFEGKVQPPLPHNEMHPGGASRASKFYQLRPIICSLIVTHICPYSLKGSLRILNRP